MNGLPWMRRAAVRASVVFGAVVAAALSGATAQGPLETATVAGSNGTWVVEGGSRVGDARVAPLLGREALWLKNNTHAIRAGVDFSDGTIEFDLAPTDRGDFVAVVFHRESMLNHENLYLRLRQSGRFMALQYAPRTNGSSTWQLYPEFNVETTWPRNRWTHVRLEVRGSRLEVFVGDSATPRLTVPRLRHGFAGGAVAFWARVNGQPEEWAAAISNLRITPRPAEARAEAPAPPPGFVARWQVTDPVPATNGETPVLPATPRWRDVRAEDSGLVNLNRVFRVQRGRHTVFARTTLTSSSARRILAGVGYSDDVTVFLNGKPLYSGVNGWESRGPEYASFVNTRHESLWLPLEAGDNELVLAVTDDQRFGWGFAVDVSQEVDPTTSGSGSGDGDA